MKNFYKIFTKILIIVWIFVANFSVSSVHAACKIDDQSDWVDSFMTMLENCQKSTNEESHGILVSSKTGIGGFKEQVNKISLQALSYAGLFAVGAMVIAGIMYTTAYGDSSRLESAKKTAIFAAVGLFIALASYTIVNGVLYILFTLR